MMEALAPGGRCAVVVPEGLLFGSTSAHVELRRKLVEDYELLAVVSLPAGVFKPYAGVKTGVVVFRRPTDAKAKKTEKIWFYDIRADGYDPDKITGGGARNLRSGTTFLIYSPSGKTIKNQVSRKLPVLKRRRSSILAAKSPAVGGRHSRLLRRTTTTSPLDGTSRSWPRSPG